MLEPRTIGILLALLGAVIFATAQLNSKNVLTKSNYPVAFGGMYQIVSAMIFLVICLFTQPELILSPAVIGLLVINIILWSVFNSLNALSTKLLDISLTGILGQTSLVFSVLGAIIVFSETQNLLAKFIGGSVNSRSQHSGCIT